MRTVSVFCLLAITWILLIGCGEDKSLPHKPKERAEPGDDKQIVNTRIKMTSIEQASRAYLLKTGEYPKATDDLWKMPKGMTQENWKGPYIESAEALNDSWGNPIQMHIDREENVNMPKVILKSFGPDGKKGGDDDFDNQPKK